MPSSAIMMASLHYFSSWICWGLSSDGDGEVVVVRLLAVPIIIMVCCGGVVGTTCGCAVSCGARALTRVPDYCRKCLYCC